MKEDITVQDYKDAALILGCESEAIQALAEVESSGSGFMPTGEITILFEPHIFWKELIKKHLNPATLVRDHPEFSDILYEKWNTRPYGKNSTQWVRLRRAAAINSLAAYDSASYGKFQIMGFNFGAAGYPSVLAMISDFNKGEKYHLKGFVNFMKSTGMDKYLASKDWDSLARHYNGSGYKNNPNTILDDYDYKLKTAYDKLIT